jgi:fluoride exporter
MTITLVAVFGVLGILSRYYIGILANRYLPAPFPHGTFIINICGAFLIGVLYVFGNKYFLLLTPVKTGLAVGYLGGFTTFSSYCLDTLKLLEDKEHNHAVFYFVASPILGVAATALGIYLTIFAGSNTNIAGQTKFNYSLSLMNKACVSKMLTPKINVDKTPDLLNYINQASILK